jgi:hypothetical protein
MLAVVGGISNVDLLLVALAGEHELATEACPAGTTSFESALVRARAVDSPNWELSRLATVAPSSS